MGVPYLDKLGFPEEPRYIWILGNDMEGYSLHRVSQVDVAGDLDDDTGLPHPGEESFFASYQWIATVWSEGQDVRGDTYETKHEALRFILDRASRFYGKDWVADQLGISVSDLELF